jgi:hypothetical protein
MTEKCKCEELIKEFEDVEEVSLTDMEKLRLMKANPSLFCAKCIKFLEKDAQVRPSYDEIMRIKRPTRLRPPYSRTVLRRPSTVIDSFPVEEPIVGILEHKNDIFVATSKHIYVLKDGTLEKIKFEVQNDENS